jgi:hypothetical protein
MILKLRTPNASNSTAEARSVSFNFERICVVENMLRLLGFYCIVSLNVAMLVSLSVRRDVAVCTYIRQ